jgi:hypothetical protein
MARPFSRIRPNTAQVRRILQSTEMQRTVGQVAGQVAGLVSAQLPLAQTSGARGRQVRGYSGLAVRVETTPTGGVRRDRAAATVIVPPPAVLDLRSPDRLMRFGVLQQIARRITGGQR